MNEPPKKLLKPAAVSSRRSFGAQADGVPQTRDSAVAVRAAVWGRSGFLL